MLYDLIIFWFCYMGLVALFGMYRAWEAITDKRAKRKESKRWN